MRLPDEWGHHRYAGEVWCNPFEALDRAIKRGDRAPDIEFVLPSVDRLDWTVEPEESLSNLYRKRAQRLREEYDCLILMYSGGSDSHQALMAFLKAGIHLDEVRTCYPMQWVQKVSGTALRDDPLGLLYEYHYAAAPGLRLVSLYSPRTKITVMDITDAYAGDMPEWQDALFGARMSGGLHGLYQAVKRVRVARDLQRAAEAIAPKRVGLIIGAEKPHLRLAGREVSVFFSDIHRVGIEHFWQHGDDLLYEPVMFYWGEPRITCKQAHIIKRALERDPRLISDGDAHRRLIYPDLPKHYQRLEAVCGGVLTQCVGERAMAIATERTRYYNGRFGRLAGIDPLSDGEPKLGPGRRLLFERQTKFYTIGHL